MKEEQKEAWRVTNPPHCKHLMYKYVELVGERGRCECCGQRAVSVRVWDRALSAAEIKADYEKQLKEGERCPNCKD